MMYLSLTSGLIILLFCGDLLVRGSVALAVRLGVPSLIVGLTVVAFGTSAPELVVCIDAALSGAPGMAIGNIVGSNIANVLLVLGLPALIAAMHCDQPFIRRNTFMMLGVTVLFIWLCFQGPLDAGTGAILLLLLLLFLGYSAQRAVAQGDSQMTAEELAEAEGLEGLPGSMTSIAVFVGLGAVGLPLGAHLIVTGGTDIALAFGVSNAVIGLTLIALGTSLPELATTVVAAMRKQPDVAVGNVLGSNLFNILAIMGITTMVAPIPVPPQLLQFDLWVLLISSVAVLPFALSHGTITKTAGALFLCSYLVYIFFVFNAKSLSIVAAAG